MLILTRLLRVSSLSVAWESVLIRFVKENNFSTFALHGEGDESEYIFISLGEYIIHTYML